MVEPVACVLHSQKLLGHRPPRNMVIIGCGPMGLIHAMAARARGVESIWIVDRDPERLALAASRGLRVDAWLSFEQARGHVDALTGGQGAEVAVIANSSRSGHALAFELTATGGLVLAFASIRDHPGAFNFADQRIDTDALHARENRVTAQTSRGPITIAGSIGFDAESFAAAAALLCRTPAADRLITNRRSLAEVPSLLVNDAWLRELKIVVEPWDSETV
jgi:L-iditol 2-dehydrogenase